jgi:hypothetical protein
MIAHHYLSALELARAADQDTASLAPRARTALQVAGDRAFALNAFAQAAAFYRAASSLWPEDAGRPRAGLLFRLALALNSSCDDDGLALKQAREALLAVGDRPGQPRHARLAEMCWLRGDWTGVSNIWAGSGTRP